MNIAEDAPRTTAKVQSMLATEDSARVLIVDDDELDRIAVRRALRAADTSVQLAECSTAQEALAMASVGEFACVVLDYLLPGVTALEFLPELRSRLGGAPVIVLTGHGDEQVAVALMKAGASDYLPKDRLDGTRLARAVEQAVTHAHTRARLAAAERAQRKYLVRLRKLVELTPTLYRTPRLEERARVGLSAAQVLFAGEEAFLGLRYTDAPLQLIARDAVIESLHGGDERWREIMNEPPSTDGMRVRVRPWGEHGANLYSTVLYGSGGQPIGVLALGALPTESVFAELTEALMAQLADMIAVALENARLFESSERAVSARDAVMAVVSHDLRSPLNSFRLGVELLGSMTNEKGTVVLRRMDHAVRHMNRLIEDLLDVSRIERNQLEIDPQPLSVGSIVEALTAMLGPIADEKHVKLVMPTPTDLRVNADRYRVTQVLQNLLSNALKFSGRGGTVTVAVTAHDERTVLFSVSDEGTGIAPEDAPRVFDRYYRQGDQGLGLGLYIAKAIVQAHGGRIWLESEPGHGARFHFTLERA